MSDEGNETRYFFNEELKEGIVRSRPNRFVMVVELNGSQFMCHCPTTRRLGDVRPANIGCLVSKSEKKTRKTVYTVEAISIDPLDKKDKSWIGINQTRTNSYIEFFLKTGQLSKMVQGLLTREIKLAHEPNGCE